MESVHFSNDNFDDIEKELNLYNDPIISDIDDEESDETYKISDNDMKELRSDRREDVQEKQAKKVKWLDYVYKFY